MDINKIYNENCIDTMKRMPNEYIDLVVTSPPYDNLRDYKGYSFDFESIAKELYRIIKDGGVIVWIVGDATINGSETLTSFKQALYFKEIGFNIYDTMIYHKKNSIMTSPYRYTPQFEYMFVITKNNPKSFNAISDKKNKWAGTKHFGEGRTRNKDGSYKLMKDVEVKECSIRGNVWEYLTGYSHSSEDEIAFNHPAIFPEKLARDHIYSWSNEGDLVYDPFMGSGTTAKEAHLLNRNWIGSEISKEYCDLANKRLMPYLNQLELF